MKIQNFKFNESGLNRFFGPLEAKVMETLWQGGEMTIKGVQKVIEQHKQVNFNTVMTVMNRLVEKGILHKRIEGRSSLYTPILSKEQFLESKSKELTSELVGEFGLLAVSHMLDAVEEADDELISLLEQKIKKLKAGES
ncbi:BlaI/MecI/CopY family transcriptional regulator [Priestia megaterium]|nr:BlaI/MecI/CopY family transcriptional regulator [Priestia megaterium]